LIGDFMQLQLAIKVLKAALTVSLLAIAGCGNDSSADSQASPDSNVTAASLVQTVARGQASAEGTTIPSARQILDSSGNVWTVSGGIIYENGALAGYSNDVTLLLYDNNIIYQENAAGGFWSWNGSAWLASSDPRNISVSGSCGTTDAMAVKTVPVANLCSTGTNSTVSGTGPWQWSCTGNNGGTTASCSANIVTPIVVPSPEGTTIPSATQITDSSGNVWTVSGGIIYENGALAGYSSGVTSLLYDNNIIYQENAAGGWWSWNGNAWLASSDPRNVPVSGGSSSGSGSVSLISSGSVSLISSSSVSSSSSGGVSSSSSGGVSSSSSGGVSSSSSGGPSSSSSGGPSSSSSGGPSSSSSGGPSSSSSGGSSSGLGASLMFSYPSGFSSAGSAITINTSAALVGSAIELTGPTYGEHQAGDAYYASPQNVSSFTTDFTFQQAPGALGMAFVVQNSNTTTNPNMPYGPRYAVNAGADSNCMGYGAYAPPINPLGSAIGNSIAIAFDPVGSEGLTISRSPALPSLVSLYLNGGPYHPMVPEQDITASGINFNNGDVISAHVVYDGSLLTLTLKDTTTNAQYRTSWPLNILAAIDAVGASGNNAWVGFTAGTVPVLAQSVLAWDFYTGYNPRLATPTFSVAAGSYTSAQLVTISAPAGATIYYTTNGLQPTTASTLYTGPISVSSNEFVQAVAVESGYTDSLVASSNYQIQSGSLPLINFPSGFSNVSGLVQLAGYAEVNSSQIELADNVNNLEAAAAWYAVPVNVRTFTTVFTLQNTSAGGGGVWGETFAIQNQNPAANDGAALSLVSGGLGSIGSGGYQNGLGYAGILESVAIKFEGDSNATGLYTNGAQPGGAGDSSENVPITGLSLSSGNPIAVTLAYDGTTLTLSMEDTVTAGSFTYSWAVNIPLDVGANTAYIGFTASNTSANANQYVNSWTFHN
jgi:hypothetical protein